jgi:hypothetical protein
VIDVAKDVPDSALTGRALFYQLKRFDKDRIVGKTTKLEGTECGVGDILSA